MILTLLLACTDLKVDYGTDATGADGGTVDGGGSDGGDTDGGDTDGGDTDGGDTDGGSEPAAGWAWGEDVPVTDADASLVGGVTEDDGDVTNLFTPGDVDGDGISDLLITASVATTVIDHTEYAYAGRIYLVLGATDGWEPAMPLAVRPGVQGHQEYNQVMSGSALGDVDGDGLADYPVTLSTSSEASTGLPGIVLGGPGAETLRTLDELDWTAGSDADSSEAFESLVGLGDIDGDGIGDLLLSAWGSLAVVYGGALDGTATLPSDADLHVSLAGWEVFDSGRGDVTGDGRTDIVLKVSSGRERIAVLWSPATSTARDGQLMADDITTTFVTTGRYVATVEVLPDVDGDGIGEVLFAGEAAGSAGTRDSWLVSGADITGSEVVVDEVGTPVFASHGGGELVVVGDSDGDGLRDMLAERGSLKAEFFKETVVVPGRSGGWGVALDEGAVATSLRIYEDNDNQTGLPDRGQHGDIDGDGMDDIVLAAHSYDRDGMEDSGQVRVFLGRTEWPTILDQHDADARFHGNVERAKAGHTFEIMDLNDDGFDDVVIGTSKYSLESENGATFIFFGQPFGD